MSFNIKQVDHLYNLQSMLNIDVTLFDEKQLEQIDLGVDNLTINSFYPNEKETSIEEIQRYAKPEYTWEMMELIRLNPHLTDEEIDLKYNIDQMRQFANPVTKYFSEQKKALYLSDKYTAEQIEQIILTIDDLSYEAAVKIADPSLTLEQMGRARENQLWEQEWKFAHPDQPVPNIDDPKYDVRQLREVRLTHQYMLRQSILDRPVFTEEQLNILLDPRYNADQMASLRNFFESVQIGYYAPEQCDIIIKNVIDPTIDDQKMETLIAIYTYNNYGIPQTLYPYIDKTMDNTQLLEILYHIPADCLYYDTQAYDNDIMKTFDIVADKNLSPDKMEVLFDFIERKTYGFTQPMSDKYWQLATSLKDEMYTADQAKALLSKSVLTLSSQTQELLKSQNLTATAIYEICRGISENFSQEQIDKMMDPTLTEPDVFIMHQCFKRNIPEEKMKQYLDNSLSEKHKEIIALGLYHNFGPKQIDTLLNSKYQPRQLYEVCSMFEYGLSYQTCSSKGLLNPENTSEQMRQLKFAVREAKPEIMLNAIKTHHYTNDQIQFLYYIDDCHNASDIETAIDMIDKNADMNYQQLQNLFDNPDLIQDADLLSQNEESIDTIEALENKHIRLEKEKNTEEINL